MQVVEFAERGGRVGEDAAAQLGYGAHGPPLDGTGGGRGGEAEIDCRHFEGGEEVDLADGVAVRFGFADEAGYVVYVVLEL